MSEEAHVARRESAAPRALRSASPPLSLVTSETTGWIAHEARPIPARLPAPRRRSLSTLLQGSSWTTLHVASDVMAAAVAVWLAAPAAAPIALLAFPLVVVAMIHLRGLYRRRFRLAFLDAAGPLLGAVSVAAMTVLTWEAVVYQDVAAASAIGRAWAITLALLLAGRLVLGLIQRQARAAGVVSKPTLIVGAGQVGAQVARRLLDDPAYGLRPVGFLDDDPPPGGSRRIPVVGSPGQLATIAAHTGAEHVILAFSTVPDRGLVTLTRECEDLGLEVSLVPRLFESINDRMALERLGGLPLFGLRAIDPKGLQFRVKYAIERPLAAFILAVMAPVMAVTALAVKLTSPGPVIFRQRRVGRDGRVFDFYKFRSMRIAEDVDDFMPAGDAAPGGVEGHDRRTPIGRFLRRTAIDELPQFFNVLRGDMSIVGPRPERPEYVELFRRDHDRYSDRHRVKSGITGWAQVHGLRGQTSLSDRIEWDNFYIENWSLWLDFKVLLMTLGAVLRSGDAA